MYNYLTNLLGSHSMFSVLCSIVVHIVLFPPYFIFNCSSSFPHQHLFLKPLRLREATRTGSGGGGANTSEVDRSNKRAACEQQPTSLLLSTWVRSAVTSCYCFCRSFQSFVVFLVIFVALDYNNPIILKSVRAGL